MLRETLKDNAVRLYFRQQFRGEAIQRLLKVLCP